MNAKYKDLFKDLVIASCSDALDEKLSQLLMDEKIDKGQLANVVASLCGVEISDSSNENHMEELKKALTSYQSIHKVVNKAKPCSMDCVDMNGETLCQKSCPFNAIYIDESTHASAIDPDKCTDCGFCIEACPAGGILDKVEFIPLMDLLNNKKPVIAAVAPAIAGQFGEGTTIDQLRTAFKKIGFTDMIEVAFFADMLTLKEAIEFDHYVKTKNDLMITSCCCPMWVGMLKRVYNDMVKYVSPSISPMIAAGRVLKTLNPECKVVFVGPCIAKKAEAKEKDVAGAIDFVLTFAEVKEIFEALEIVPDQLEEDHSSEYASRGGRLYARTGGVSTAVSEAIERLFPKKYDFLKTAQANGVKECKEMLAKAKAGELDANFIEGMGCVGGCVGGPKANIPRDLGTQNVNQVAENSSIKVAVDSTCMDKILKKIGIDSVEDFKNSEKIEIFERKF